MDSRNFWGLSLYSLLIGAAKASLYLEPTHFLRMCRFGVFIADNRARSDLIPLDLVGFHMELEAAADRKSVV